MLDFAEASVAVTHNPKVIAFVDEATRTYEWLRWQADLSPRNYGVNARLSSLVREAMRKRPAQETEEILGMPQLRAIAPGLQKLTARAECEMEKFCSAAFIGDHQGVTDRQYTCFDDFIYMKNYEALIDQEMHAMGWPRKQPPLDPRTESIAFIGAGPLPVSAIMLHMKTGHPVTCIDSDAEACRLGYNLIDFLARSNPRYAGLTDKMTFVHAPGHRHDYVTHPIVFVASLIDRKAPVLMRIIGSSDTVSTVVVRSAEGLSTLLYAPHKNLAGLEEYNFYFSGKTKPSAAAINTSLVYKMPPGKMRTRHKIDFASPMSTDDVTSLKQRPRPMWRTASQDATI